LNRPATILGLFFVSFLFSNKEVRPMSRAHVCPVTASQQAIGGLVGELKEAIKNEKDPVRRGELQGRLERIRDEIGRNRYYGVPSW